MNLISGYWKMSKLKVKEKEATHPPSPKLGSSLEGGHDSRETRPHQIELWPPQEGVCNQADLSIISPPGLPPLMSLSASVCPKRAGGKTSWQPPGSRATKTSELPSPDTCLTWSDLINVISPTQQHTWQGTGPSVFPTAPIEPSPHKGIKEGGGEDREGSGGGWGVARCSPSQPLRGQLTPKKIWDSCRPLSWKRIPSLNSAYDAWSWQAQTLSSEPLIHRIKLQEWVRYWVFKTSQNKDVLFIKSDTAEKMCVDLPTIKYKGWSSHQ